MGKRKKTDWRWSSICFLLLLLVCVPGVGRAALSYTYGFDPVIDGDKYNSGDYAPQVADQLTMTVSQYGSNQVQFKFLNVGSVASSITDIWFDDGALLNIAQVINPQYQEKPLIRVAFTQDSLTNSVHPTNLGSLEAIGFETSQAFGDYYLAADSDSPTKPNGVDNSGLEWVSIIFNLKENMGFNNVIEGLNNATSLRVALKVQAIGPQDKSDAFINDPEPVVPLPGAVLLGMLGLNAAGLKLRKFA